MISYGLVIIPIVSFVMAQFIKVALFSMRRKLTLYDLSAYGGMPSAHSAAVVSVATVAALHDGVNSVSFAIALILTVLIIRDAVGLRMHLSEHSRVLNKIVKDVHELDHKKFPRLGERLGHTWPEVIAGSLVGLLIAFIMYAFFI